MTYLDLCIPNDQQGVAQALEIECDPRASTIELDQPEHEPQDQLKHEKHNQPKHEQ